jgi:hypothetical protein
MNLNLQLCVVVLSHGVNQLETDNIYAAIRKIPADNRRQFPGPAPLFDDANMGYFSLTPHSNGTFFCKARALLVQGNPMSPYKIIGEPQLF